MRLVIASAKEKGLLEEKIAQQALAQGFEVDFIPYPGTATSLTGDNKLKVIPVSQEEYQAQLAASCNDASALIINDANEMMGRMKSAMPRLAVMGIRSFSPGQNVGEVLDQSYDSLLRNKMSLVIGAIADSQGAPERAVILTVERGIRPVKGFDNIPGALMELLPSRIGGKHYRSETLEASLPWAVADDLKEIARHTKEWAGWSLFPKYQAKGEKYPGAEFGFVAKRTGAGTLITARGSNKESPTDKDFALIAEIEDRTIKVKGQGKASLNGPLAHYIFEQRPEVNYIVHSHIFIPDAPETQRVTAPGTLEDRQSIEAAVKAGVKVINQPMHGTIILLERPEDLLPLLKANGLYNKRSELYDAAYARFQSNETRLTSLEQAVQGLGLPADAKLLDLCCGTGASTLALQRLGFTNIDIADGSSSMLAVAQERTSKRGVVTRLEDLSAIKDQYDLITVRQAFAYVHPDDLPKVAQNIAGCLKEGGKFVFNGFIRQEPGSKPRDVENQNEDMLVRTHEDNQITPEMVRHTQRSEIVDFNGGKWHAVFDINEFYQHDPELIEQAFAAAGFHVDFSIKGQSICFTNTLKERKVEIPAEKFSMESCHLELPEASLAAMEEKLAKDAKQIIRASSSYPGTMGWEQLRDDVTRITPNWKGDVLITGAATEGTFLALQHVGRGKRLAVNIPCFFGILRQAKSLGIEVVPWQTMAELEQAGKVDAILLTSNLTPPTGISFSDSDKAKIAQIARANNAWVIEDNAYEPLWFGKAPTPIPADPEKSIRVGSLSKICSPGFRLGFMRAEGGIINQIRSEKITGNLSTALPLQIIASAALTDELLHGFRAELRERAEILRRAITKRFGFTPEMPAGGTYMRLALPDGINLPALIARSGEKGVSLDDNRHQYPDGQNRPYIRLHYGAIKATDIGRAVGIIHAAFQEVYAPPPSRLNVDIGADIERK